MVFRENNEYTKGKDAFPFCFFFNGMECICLSPWICGWIGLLPLFMLSLPVQAELRCVANTVDIEPFFSAATAEDKQQVEQAINSSVNLVPFGLSASDWKVHRGDLVVEGNIESNQKLIVLGNLTVKGNISTFSLSNPWVILGNVTATNIVTDSPLLITGSINASGLVFIDSYYDNPSSIKGVLMRVEYLSMT